MNKFIMAILRNMVKECPDSHIHKAVRKTMAGMGCAAALNSVANAVNFIDSFQPISEAEEVKRLIVETAVKYVRPVSGKRKLLDGQTFLLSVLVYLSDEYSYRDFCSIVNAVTRGWKMKEVAEKLYDVLSFFETWNVPNGNREWDDFRSLMMEALINRLNYKKTGC